MNATQILQEKDKIIRAKDQRIAELEKENQKLKSDLIATEKDRMEKVDQIIEKQEQLNEFLNADEEYADETITSLKWKITSLANNIEARDRVIEKYAAEINKLQDRLHGKDKEIEQTEAEHDNKITSLEKELKDVKYGRDEVNKLNLQRTEDLRSANETIQSLQSQLTKCQEERREVAAKAWDMRDNVQHPWSSEEWVQKQKQQYLSQFDQPKTKQ